MRVGIDLGTCSTRVAWRDRDEVRFLRNPVRSTPSHPTAGYCGSEGVLRVGEAAEARRDSDPENYWGEFKRDLGCDSWRHLGGRTFRAEDLAAALLGQLRRRAEEDAGRPCSGVVLTVPVCFFGHRRRGIEQAARQGGFEQVELLTEPEAVALYLERGNRLGLQEGCRVLVYDLGGGTFDAALFLRRGGRLELEAAPVGAPDLGGREFDCLLMAEVLRCHPALDRELRGRSVEARRLRSCLEDLCRERGKHVLAELDEAEIPLPPALATVQRLTRCAFRALSGPLLDRTIDLCRDLLGRGKPSQGLTIALAGGATRLPFVSEWLRAAFPGATLAQAGDPSLAVCHGAVVKAAERDEAERDAAGAAPRAYEVRPLWP